MRGKYSEQQKIATDKYVAENYDRIQIKVRKGKKEKINELAKAQGKSTSAFIIDLIEEKAKQLNFDMTTEPTPSQLRKENKE